MGHNHVEFEDDENCSIGWIKSPEDTESFKLSIDAEKSTVILFSIKGRCPKEPRFLELFPKLGVGGGQES